MINYSFIIPHKNTPDLLQKCLDSIPRRDDVQIIVVDDNSDADKVDFEKFPGLDDPCVEVYLTKEGKGAGYARNVGLKHAVGKWLVFADADDYFNSVISEVLDTYSTKDFDLAIWRTSCLNLDTGQAGTRGQGLNTAFSQALSSGDIIRLLLVSTPIKGIYLSDVIKKNNIQFNECRWANDVVFSAKVAESVAKERVILIDRPVYCITEHSSYGLVSNGTYESHKVRFEQECESVSILRKSSIKELGFVYYWCFVSWFDIYKLYGLRKALILLPKAVKSCGIRFFKQFIDIKWNRV